MHSHIYAGTLDSVEWVIVKHTLSNNVLQYDTVNMYEIVNKNEYLLDIIWKYLYK